MPTFRVDIGYDGTGFRGYARNEGIRSVQGEIEGLLSKIAGAPVDTVVAGRTDAGVHARHNVVSFELPDPVDPDRIERSINSSFGGEIVATSVKVVPDGFHARFSAMWRSYRYLVDDSGHPEPLARHRVWAVRWPLDVELMDAAAATFVGDHDFASLCRGQEGRSTQRTVVEAGWRRTGGDGTGSDGTVSDGTVSDGTVSDGTVLVFAVRAKAFCHQMVRSMVALTVDVGRGRVPVDAVAGIIEARDRQAARGAAPPHGLVLWEVGY